MEKAKRISAEPVKGKEKKKERSCGLKYEEAEKRPIHC
jgi:hypothetical protein